MKWFRRNPKQYHASGLVRLVTTNDERSMLLTTAAFDVDWLDGDTLSVQYRPRDQRGVAPIDPEEERLFDPSHRDPVPQPTGKPSIANNLRWPRPIIIPAQFVPRDFDENNEEHPSGFSQKFAQQSAENFFPMSVSDEDAERFNKELWSRLTYRLRCYAWSIWQRHLKDWWFFVRYPLAFGAALAYAIATVVHLARSHP